MYIHSTVNLIQVPAAEANKLNKHKKGKKMAKSDRFEKGMVVRRKVLGDAYVDQAMQKADTRRIQTAIEKTGGDNNQKIEYQGVLLTDSEEYAKLITKILDMLLFNVLYENIVNIILTDFPKLNFDEKVSKLTEINKTLKL
jgi:hypothetical protein